MVPRVVEQHLRAEHVGEDELGRAEDRAVDVRLGGEVDDRVAAGGRARDGLRVGDVALVELVLDALEVRPVAGVGELVEHDDLLAAPQPGAVTKCEPMKPAPPVTRTRIARRLATSL